jgi:hypothetical protein
MHGGGDVPVSMSPDLKRGRGGNHGGTRLTLSSEGNHYGIPEELIHTEMPIGTPHGEELNTN